MVFDSLRLDAGRPRLTLRSCRAVTIEAGERWECPLQILLTGPGPKLYELSEYGREPFLSSGFLQREVCGEFVRGDTHDRAVKHCSASW